MEVVVTGRQIEVSDRFREHVTDKLARLEKHDQRIMPRVRRQRGTTQLSISNEMTP